MRVRKTTPAVGLVPARSVELPDPSGSWTPAVKAEWVALFESPTSGLFQATDLPGIYRLFDLRDQRARYAKAVAKSPLVEGSQGQPRSNPLLKEIHMIDAEVRQLEDRFGLNPQARLKLGLRFADSQQVLADLNTELADEVADDAERFRVIDAG